VFAYLYEQGDDTIWGSAVARTTINTMGMLFLFSHETTTAFAPLYLVLAIVVAVPLMVSAYRGRHYVRGGESIEAAPAVSRDSEALSAYVRRRHLARPRRLPARKTRTLEGPCV
jgi:hypothetical protein